MLAYLAGLLSGAVILVAGVLALELTTTRTPASMNSELVERFGAQMHRVDELACGELTDAAGCFHPPALILVDADLGELEHDVVLHELGHLIQYRAGVSSDECGADAIAIALGAETVGYPECGE